MNQLKTQAAPWLTTARKAHYEQRLEYHQQEIVKDQSYYQKFKELEQLSIEAADQDAANRFAQAAAEQVDEINHHEYQINFLERQLGLIANDNFRQRRPRNVVSLASPEAPKPIVDGFSPDPECEINQLRRWNYDDPNHWFNNPTIKNQARNVADNNSEFFRWINGDLDD